MRVAVIGPTHPYKGGIAQHTTELAHRLAARGHQVAIESWSDQYPARLYPGVQRVAEPEMEPFGQTRYPLSWRRPDGWVRLGRRLRREADAVVLVVVTPIQAPAYLAILAALRGGTGRRRGRGPRVLALCHNVLPHERRAVDEPLVRAVLRRVSAVLVHTPAQAELAATLTPAPVVVAEMAPHLWSSPTRRRPEAIEAGTGAGTRTRAEPTAGGGPRRSLLFFGLVRPYKGLDVLLRALARGPADVRLTVAGEFWGDAAQTTHLIAELGLTDRVDVRAGYVDAAEVPGLFSAADALVLPYRAGTASQNVDLAHLHGLPVIATTVGTLATAVRDGVDGLLVGPDDVDALAAALRRLYEPGVLADLRAKVSPPDPQAAWGNYLDAALGALGGEHRGG
ncbi:glycosyltransferase family 4 protein [Frankia sp. QA3]|uniref:glycosyltransferase family 4 protein n=1 Tax=Frankia sp. QA3 TaxID=710111 RepID=UPI000269C5F1|nr:glycosyltransferase [Frankia sp. QA3]EIV93977.1 glycosyltransferase [Frankia sp. QA3]